MQYYIILALIAMVLFGINGIIFKIAPNIDAVSLALVNFATAAVGTFIYWFFFVAEKQISLSGAGFGILAGVISVAALITFIAALQLGNVSTVNTIRALSAGITVILALVFLAEKLTLIKGAGVLLGVIAVVLLSL